MKSRSRDGLAARGLLFLTGLFYLCSKIPRNYIPREAFALLIVTNIIDEKQDQFPLYLSSFLQETFRELINNGKD